MKSEYVACSTAAQEAIWLKRFFQSLRVTSLADEAVKMYCDNMVALSHAVMLKILSIIAKANTYRLVITTFVLLLHKER